MKKLMFAFGKMRSLIMVSALFGVCVLASATTYAQPPRSYNLNDPIEKQQFLDGPDYAYGPNGRVYNSNAHSMKPVITADKAESLYENVMSADSAYRIPVQFLGRNVDYWFRDWDTTRFDGKKFSNPQLQNATLITSKLNDYGRKDLLPYPVCVEEPEDGLSLAMSELSHLYKEGAPDERVEELKKEISIIQKNIDFFNKYGCPYFEILQDIVKDDYWFEYHMNLNGPDYTKEEKFENDSRYQYHFRHISANQPNYRYSPNNVTGNWYHDELGLNLRPVNSRSISPCGDGYEYKVSKGTCHKTGVETDILYDSYGEPLYHDGVWGGGRSLRT